MDSNDAQKITNALVALNMNLGNLQAQLTDISEKLQQLTKAIERKGLG